jgi:hypothetical protein
MGVTQRLPSNTSTRCSASCRTGHQIASSSWLPITGPSRAKLDPEQLALPHLLCVDEVDYVSYNSRYADLLFEVVTRRYDTGKPLLLSTNKAFSEWGEVFPHAACVVTLVDRLIHRAEIIEIDADSYRLKEAKELDAARTKRRSKKAATPS